MKINPVILGNNKILFNKGCAKLHDNYFSEIIQ